MATKENFIKRAPVTIVLIIINVLVMIGLAMNNIPGEPNNMMNTWAAYTPAILAGKEYYRLFTSMFLHFGFEHLFNNMLLLFFLGEIIENRLGSVRYLFIYLLGGVLGNLLSLWMDLKLPINQMPISAGASGAVFALIGATAYLLILNKGRLEGVSFSRLLLLIVLSIWDGARNPTIDGAAHIGGLIAGFLLTLIVYRKREAANYILGDMAQDNEMAQGDIDEDNMHSRW